MTVAASDVEERVVDESSSPPALIMAGAAPRAHIERLRGEAGPGRGGRPGESPADGAARLPPPLLSGAGRLHLKILIFSINLWVLASKFQLQNSGLAHRGTFLNVKGVQCEFKTFQGLVFVIFVSFDVSRTSSSRQQMKGLPIAMS